MNTKGLPEKVVRAAGLEPALTYVNKIFLPTTAFTATKKCLWSGLSLDHIILDLGPVRQVSTPSLSGLARDCHLKGFPEFEQFYSYRFQ
ncbi:MAG TPA: hypothetical protein EYQ26_15565 [Rhodospirillales bacterium]|nr:hypothetical protein [Rhodospirillales bacterium]HIL74961.1 hypothetical protein [Rhodospirillales bacterium]|tara:strand:+ start:279 stop:545 length:267 start_codon:yes stop_codon:yes gene_type:complete